MKPLQFLPGLCAFAALAVALPSAGGASEGDSPPPLPKIVATSCQGCHAVRAHMPSPNPHAPGFEAIANLEGVTPNTIKAFLRNAHNYPEEMTMTLSKDQVNEIAAYMLTLRSKDYRPIP